MHAALTKLLHMPLKRAEHGAQEADEQEAAAAPAGVRAPHAGGLVGRGNAPWCVQVTPAACTPGEGEPRWGCLSATCWAGSQPSYHLYWHRVQVAEETYRETFGDDFDRIVPVYDPRAVGGWPRHP